MNKKFMIVSLFIVLLVFSAASCSKAKTTNTGLGGFIGGTEGLTASFVADQPPVAVLDAGNYPFAITLLLENKGEYEINANEIMTTLEGISYSAFSIKNPVQRNEAPLDKGRLDKATNNVIEGGQSEVSYEANFVDDISFDSENTISVNTCYKYQTHSISPICLTKVPTQRARVNDVCAITEQKGIGNSGSPIQLTSMSERASGQNEITLIFTIENKGQGETYGPEYINSPKCATDDKKKDFVNVRVVSPEGLPMECAKLGPQNIGAVRLINGKSTLTCKANTAQLAQTAPFIGEMEVYTDFTYKEHVSTPVMVQNTV